jgi:hypothetical protein
MQPFNRKTLYSLLIAVGGYGLCYFLFHNVHGWIGIFAKAGLFSAILITGVFWARLTPDAWQLYHNLKKRFQS